MDMGGTGMGMDSSGDGMFRGTNMSISRGFWYLVVAVVALLALQRVTDKVRTGISLAKFKRQPSTIPSRPANWISQTYDTIIALCRELGYPQIYWLSGPHTKYFNPPALGRCLLLLAYWIFILTALWSNTILMPSSPNYAYKWEIVGFRAAWVSVMQLPLIYCLGSKINAITFITGISYERLNWLHRWIARTLFLTVIVHWSFFFREWWLANFVQLELQMMPMVKYGFGAWATLGWMVLTGFGFFRQLSYEFFVLQHVVSFTVLLWLVYTHVPSYAQYNVWLAISFVVLDHGWRYIALLVQNLHSGLVPGKERQKYIFGFAGHAQAVSGGYVVLTIDHLTTSTGAGQHIYISFPRCGLFQWHPFTVTRRPGSSSGKIVLKAQSGFTQKLFHLANQKSHGEFRVFISSPFGSPPLDIIERSDSLILLATSTGASYTVSILQHVANKTLPIRRICFFWVVRDRLDLNWFSSEIHTALEKIQSSGINLSIQVYVTGKRDIETSTLFASQTSSLLSQGDKVEGGTCGLTEDFTIPPRQEKSEDLVEEGSGNMDVRFQNTSVASSSSSQSSSTFSSFPLMYGRPASLDSLIRPTIEDSDGETAIIACGNPNFMAQIRNYTAALSDERAVHKGTGAQGIFLFTETYGW